MFEASLPRAKKTEEKIQFIQSRLAALEAKGALTPLLRRQFTAAMEIERNLQAGMVCRLSLHAGEAFMESAPRPSGTPKARPNMSYTVRGFGSGRKIHFEALPALAAESWICPPADFLIEGKDVVVSTGSGQKFHRTH